MFVWLALASALASGSPVPQDPLNPPPTTELPAVVVDGRQLADRAREFVGAATEGPRGRALARWENSICFGVVNLQADAAQALIDRMAEVAVALGIRTEAPGCRPNLMVIVAGTADAEAMVRGAIDRDQFDFRPARGGTDRGSAALEAFAASTEPVRWWHVSLPVQVRNGAPAILLDHEILAESGAKIPGSDEELKPMLITTVDSFSRIRATTRNDLMRVIIVVDADQAAAVPFSALADYLSLVGLAQIDPDAEVGEAPTILNLFNPDAVQPTRRMTEWDAAFLISLYEARNNPTSLNHHQGDMGRRLARVIQTERAARD